MWYINMWTHLTCFVALIIYDPQRMKGEYHYRNNLRLVYDSHNVYIDIVNILYMVAIIIILKVLSRTCIEPKLCLYIAFICVYNLSTNKDLGTIL